MGTSGRLEHLAQSTLLAEVVGAGVEGLLPARGQDLLELGAATRELAVGEDASSRAFMPGCGLRGPRAGDGVRHVLLLCAGQTARCYE